MGSESDQHYDALIVGAGFSGVYILHLLREIGLKCKVSYRTQIGIRVDCDVPVYEYSEPELWKDWTWTEKYPSGEEIRKYFDHVDRVWDIKKDVEFNLRVIGGQFDVKEENWKIRTDDGRTTTCKFFILATGFAAKPYTPSFKGIESFKGAIHHSCSWPKDGVDTRGKRVGVIGTGATGVQIAQECAKDADSLTVFQRTPNLAPGFFRNRLKTFGGMKYTFMDKKVEDATPAEREEFLETAWANGGFEFWLAGYSDTFFDIEANRLLYDFWAKKTRERIKDPEKRDILAPLEPIHPFGTKRPSLEQNYYEIFNQPNVDVVDLRKNNIEEIKPGGILVSDGSFYPLDIIALATGYDAVTGGMVNMG